jgi:hypothetical protein
MSVQQHGSLSIREVSQAFCTAAVNTRLTLQVLHRKSIVPQASANLTDVIQHRNHAPKFFGHASHHLVDEHFGTADSQSVDDVADRGPCIRHAPSHSCSFFCDLNHGNLCLLNEEKTI